LSSFPVIANLNMLRILISPFIPLQLKQI